MPSPPHLLPCHCQYYRHFPSTSSLTLLAGVALLLLFATTLLPTRVVRLPPSSTLTDDPPPSPDIRVFLGVFTVARFYERRNLVRLTYALQQPVARAEFDVRFIICNVTDEDDAVHVALEMAAYGDIVVLDCLENVDGGKTYAYFSTVPRLINRPHYDYVVKADDDTHFRLDALAGALRGTARAGTYFGLIAPCGMGPYHGRKWMSGMGYALSWDVVEWVAAAELPRRWRKGTEDVMVGIWLREGGAGKNVYGAEPLMYDFWNAATEMKTCYRHEFIPGTIAVHKLKTRRQWARTFAHFNATGGASLRRPVAAAVRRS